VKKFKCEECGKDLTSLEVSPVVLGEVDEKESIEPKYKLHDFCSYMCLMHSLIGKMSNTELLFWIDELKGYLKA
jgi:hypothetical protein